MKKYLIKSISIFILFILGIRINIMDLIVTEMESRNIDILRIR